MYEENLPRIQIEDVSPGPGARNTRGVTAVLALPVDEANPISVASKGDEEQALIERCLAGDSESFRPLVQRYQRVAFSVALRMLGSRADAEDVSQQGFADAYAALDRFRGEGRASAFSTWLLRIVINRSKDILKSKKRTEAPLESDVAGEQAMFAHEPESPEAVLDRAQERQRMELALLRVPLKYREVLVLKDVEDLSYEEIRGILRLPITTLKMRVVRARAMMRAELESVPR
jgi:RNA polymerase sigma-70 factor (ECF subfamily)